MTIIQYFLSKRVILTVAYSFKVWHRRSWGWTVMSWWLTELPRSASKPSPVLWYKDNVQMKRCYIYRTFLVIRPVSGVLLTQMPGGSATSPALCQSEWLVVCSLLYKNPTTMNTILTTVILYIFHIVHITVITQLHITDNHTQSCAAIIFVKDVIIWWDKTWVIHVSPHRRK